MDDEEKILTHHVISHCCDDADLGTALCGEKSDHWTLTGPIATYLLGNVEAWGDFGPCLMCNWIIRGRLEWKCRSCGALARSSAKTLMVVELTPGMVAEARPRLSQSARERIDGAHVRWLRAPAPLSAPSAPYNVATPEGRASAKRRRASS